MKIVFTIIILIQILILPVNDIFAQYNHLAPTSITNKMNPEDNNEYNKSDSLRSGIILHFVIWMIIPILAIIIFLNITVIKALTGFLLWSVIGVLGLSLIYLFVGIVASLIFISAGITEEQSEWLIKSHKKSYLFVKSIVNNKLRAWFCYAFFSPIILPIFALQELQINYFNKNKIPTGNELLFFQNYAEKYVQQYFSNENEILKDKLKILIVVYKMVQAGFFYYPNKIKKNDKFAEFIQKTELKNQPLTIIYKDNINTIIKKICGKDIEYYSKDWKRLSKIFKLIVAKEYIEFGKKAIAREKTNEKFDKIFHILTIGSIISILFNGTNYIVNNILNNAINSFDVNRADRAIIGISFVVLGGVLVLKGISSHLESTADTSLKEYGHNLLSNLSISNDLNLKKFRDDIYSMLFEKYKKVNSYIELNTLLAMIETNEELVAIINLTKKNILYLKQHNKKYEELYNIIEAFLKYYKNLNFYYYTDKQRVNDKKFKKDSIEKFFNFIIDLNYQQEALSWIDIKYKTEFFKAA